MKSILLSVLCTIFIINVVTAQTIPFSSEQWEIQAQQYLLDEYKGNQSIYLKNGKAWLKGIEFQDGIIEFDLFMEKRRSFSGIVFRMEDKSNYEEIYLRPHLDGKPDAMQYTPVNNGASAWQLYHDQASAVIDGFIGWEVHSKGGHNAIFNFPYGRWFHLKLVVSGTRADLYLDEQESPVLQIKELKRGFTSGSIGITSGRGAAHFANFSFQQSDDISLAPLAVLKEKEATKGIIPNWSVSNVFEEKLLQSNVKLEAPQLAKMTWQSKDTESTGMLNISELHKNDRKNNTVFAKVRINSDQDQVKRLDFGYSDRAKVYCNQQILYSGNNGYRSRDYRFLGTIGFFDSVYLPLKKGSNEIIIAVSESFGGWGLQGKIDNMEGITIETNEY